MHCFVSMYLSGRKSLFNVFSSKHGVSSVPCIVQSAVSMSFYCRNTYLYWEYLIPLITVILSHRALLTSELETIPTRLWVSNYEATPCWGVVEGRGEGLFSRVFGLHWARPDCPSFPNECCTQLWASASAGARKQDHCSLGEMSCWNGQYLWQSLHGGRMFQFYCSTVSYWFKDKRKQTNPNPGYTKEPFCRLLYFCLERSRLDKGLMPSDLVFFPGCSVHSLFLRCECTLM